MQVKDFSVFLLTLLSTTVIAYPGVPSKIADLIDKWAPLVKLAQNETWRPSSVDFFLSHCKMEGCSDQPNPSVLTSSNLERCNRDSYLTTKERLSCPSCTDPVVLLGQDPSVVPVYVIYREHNNFLDIAYWMLFPYNRGKQVCIGFFQKGCFICPEFLGRCPCGGNLGCIGVPSSLFHHVGDWEKVIVRFRKVNTHYQIYSIWLSIHNDEITAKFGGEFLWKDGYFQKRDQTVAMYNGTHAVVYCAKGSHGMWPDPGRHVWLNLTNGDSLEDEASSGKSWHTWKHLKPVQYDPDGQYSGEFKFMGFQGQWGNRKRGCAIVELFIKECQLNSGPIGPSRFPKFET